jgi:metallophosphoesterase (TIGR00282 family)
VLNILFIGDVVGPPGLEFLQQALPLFRKAHDIDLVIANAENAAGGSGITARLFRKVVHSGVDLVTLGDHIYKKSEIIQTLENDSRVCKPANFPPDAPGRNFAVAPARDGTRVAVFSVLGRQFMRPVDCPFRAAERVLEELAGVTRCVVVDVHAEATAEKYLMGHFLKGRVSAVLGTHTHVPTADEQILPGGTAFISDVGMTGPYDSILGRRIDRVLTTTVTFVPTMFEVADGDPRMAGAVVEVEPATGRATAIRRVMLDEKGLEELRKSQQAEARPALPPVM